MKNSSLFFATAVLAGLFSTQVLADSKLKLGKKLETFASSVCDNDLPKNKWIHFPNGQEKSPVATSVFTFTTKFFDIAPQKFTDPTLKSIPVTGLDKQSLRFLVPEGEDTEFQLQLDCGARALSIFYGARSKYQQFFLDLLSGAVLEVPTKFKFADDLKSLAIVGVTDRAAIQIFTCPKRNVGQACVLKESFESEVIAGLNPTAQLPTDPDSVMKVEPQWSKGSFKLTISSNSPAMERVIFNCQKGKKCRKGG